MLCVCCCLCVCVGADFGEFQTLYLTKQLGEF